MPTPGGSSAIMPPAPSGSYPLSHHLGYPPYAPANSFPTPNSNPYPPYPPYPQFPTTTSTSYPSYPPYSPYPSGGFGGPSSTPNSISGGTGTIKDEHIRESLLTAIEEKLMRRMKEQFQQNQAEMETLKRTQEELKQGRSKLDSILMRLAKEQVIAVKGDILW